jgi:hypothetical protein
MEMEDAPVAPPQKNTAQLIWAACVVLLIGPSLLVWIVRGVAFVAACAPGPEPCRGMTLGGGLRDALGLAWLVATNLLLLITLALIATLAAFFRRRPLTGTLSFFLLPMLALALPALAVYTAMYEGCQVNPDGVGSCALWGAEMGSSFHTAATVPDIIFGMTPYCVALTVMLGLAGWFFAHPHRRPHKPQVNTAMAMRSFGEDAPDGED